MTLPWHVEGMQILVVGAARTGRATARFLTNAGARITLVDQAGEENFPGLREEMTSLGVQVEFGPHEEGPFRRADGVVLSPGVPSSLDVLKHARQRGMPVVSEMELASWFLKAPMIAITGTNGKTTTTTLAGEILKQWGRRVFVGGNIGNPLINAVNISPQPEFIVIEVSSFQLEGTDSFRPRVAALLNIAEDHLDRHTSMDIYRQAKGRIFLRQGAGDVAVVNLDDEEVLRILPSLPSMDVWGFSLREVEGSKAEWRGDEIRLKTGENPQAIPIDVVQLRTLQGAQNVMAACLCALAVGCPFESIQPAIEGFSGLEHRMEFVGDFNGVHVINDSKATNVGAVVSALGSCDNPVVLIAGGKDKGIDFTPLWGPANRKARAVVLLGEAAGRMANALHGAAPIHRAKAMAEAVQKAFEIAQPGDIVLLSPACSSFDQYRDYEERGEDFKAAFRQIAASRGVA